MADQFNAVAWDIEREILFKDDYIVRAAKRCGIEPESRLVCPIPGDPGTVEFILPRGEFAEWKTQHSVRIKTNFVSKGKYQYVIKPAKDWVTHKYHCQCWGNLRE